MKAQSRRLLPCCLKAIARACVFPVSRCRSRRAKWCHNPWSRERFNSPVAVNSFCLASMVKASAAIRASDMSLEQTWTLWVNYGQATSSVLFQWRSKTQSAWTRETSISGWLVR